ncbi:MAG: hypothetical protein CMP75_03790 [Flavobacteriales bacterium]|nr:hypothetical protein [Flavobacteriales bacterium]|tara:strand:+ start:1800 stop:2384 length:585 start_codon:yes stop_codon:yes gene_type:complete
MKAIKVLIVIIAIFCCVAYLLPKEFEVNRTIEINAPMESIYEQASVLSNWANWSAWHEMDPEADYTYSSPNAGVGAYYSWDGNPDLVGQGKLTILEADGSSSLKTEVIFLKDGEENGRGNGVWALSETNGVTLVVWSFLGDMGYNPIARWMGLLMDGILGPQLESGLNNMKEYLENIPAEEVVEELHINSVILE